MHFSQYHSSMNIKEGCIVNILCKLWQLLNAPNNQALNKSSSSLQLHCKNEINANFCIII